jgi:5-(carboxyamino)imidazole ribonucleotide mutase
MGSQSDWEVMQYTCDILEQFQIPFEKKIISAHRTPDRLFEFASQAHTRGLKMIIAGAGGAAHLPGMTAAKTALPVLGVPIPVGPLTGQDALLSIVQMPAGVPVATFAIGKPGAINAALFAIEVLSVWDGAIQKKWLEYRQKQTDSVIESVVE